MRPRERGRRQAAALVLWAILPALALASEEVADQEAVECAVCHLAEESDELTDRGKFYEATRTLEGYDLVVGRFARCTYCHDGSAGSREFTRNGVRFKWMMQDMEGLRQWLLANHPPRPSEDPEPERPAEEEAGG